MNSAMRFISRHQEALTCAVALLILIGFGLHSWQAHEHKQAAILEHRKQELAREAAENRKADDGPYYPLY